MLEVVSLLPTQLAPHPSPSDDDVHIVRHGPPDPPTRATHCPYTDACPHTASLPALQMISLNLRPACQSYLNSTLDLCLVIHRRANLT